MPFSCWLSSPVEKQEYFVSYRMHTIIHIRTMVTKAQNLPIANFFTNQSKNYKRDVLHIKHLPCKYLLGGWVTRRMSLWVDFDSKWPSSNRQWKLVYKGGVHIWSRPWANIPQYMDHTSSWLKRDKLSFLFIKWSNNHCHRYLLRDRMMKSCIFMLSVLATFVCPIKGKAINYITWDFYNLVQNMAGEIFVHACQILKQGEICLVASQNFS